MDTEVVSRRGRYREVAENLQVKEVVVGDGEHRANANPIIAPKLTERGVGARVLGWRRTNGCAARASGRYGRFRLTGTGRATGHLPAAHGGKFVVHSNDDTSMALGYKQLQRFEQAWRQLKSGLRLRPVYHWAVHRIHAHCVPR